LALNVKLTSSAAKYLGKLDKTTRRRITDRLNELADKPFDLRISYPLQGTTKRSSRVGGYRILFEVGESDLVIAAVGPRGQVYRDV
jgi:mRNA interferase RelE/StbE